MCSLCSINFPREKMLRSMYVDDPLFSLELMGFRALHSPYQSLRIARSLNTVIGTST